MSPATALMPIAITASINETNSNVTLAFILFTSSSYLGFRPSVLNCQSDNVDVSARKSANTKEAVKTKSMVSTVPAPGTPKGPIPQPSIPF